MFLKILLYEVDIARDLIILIMQNKQKNSYQYQNENDYLFKSDNYDNILNVGKTISLQKNQTMHFLQEVKNTQIMFLEILSIDILVDISSANCIHPHLHSFFWSLLRNYHQHVVWSSVQFSTSTINQMLDPLTALKRLTLCFRFLITFQSANPCHFEQTIFKRALPCVGFKQSVLI